MKNLIFMREAFKEAEKASSEEEVPVGAVCVYNDQIIARAHNLSFTKGPIAHAEILVLKDLSEIYGLYTPEGVSLYVTSEPCLMCFGAILNSRISSLFFGLREYKSGFLNYVDIDKIPNISI